MTTLMPPAAPIDGAATETNVNPELLAAITGTDSTLPVLTRREGVRIFCYHGIVERKTDAHLERNFHLRDTFTEHIRFLRQFRLLSLAELLEELSAKGDDSRPAAVVQVMSTPWSGSIF